MGGTNLIPLHVYQLAPLDFVKYRLQSGILYLLGWAPPLICTQIIFLSCFFIETFELIVYFGLFFSFVSVFSKHG